jgi:hypothetical protein
MDEALANRDYEAMQQLGKELEQPPEPAEAPPAEQPPQSETPPTDGGQQQTPPEPSSQEPQAQDGDKRKVFPITYRGREVELDDPDSFLGRGNTGELKKAFGHSQLYIADLERRLEEREGMSRAEITRLQRELEAAKQQRPAQPEAQQQQPKQQAQQQQVEMPTLPERPRLSHQDPAYWDENDRKLMDEYNEKRDTYDRQMAEYVRSMNSRPAQVPEDMQQELERLRRFENEYSQRTQTEREQDAERKYWGSIDKFASDHRNEFGLSKPAAEVHRDIDSWMDKLAAANRVNKPIGPQMDAQGRMTQEWREYEASRNRLTRQYLDGDQRVTQNAAHLETPADFETYFRIVEVENARQRYIRSGELAENAPLERAFLYDAAVRGDLNKTVESVATSEREKGAQAAGEAVAQHAQSAVSMPPNASARAVGVDLTAQDIEWWRNIDGPMLSRLNDHERARYMEIKDKLEQNNWLRAS